MTLNHTQMDTLVFGEFLSKSETFNRSLVPDGTRPSRSRPSSPASPCSTARSHSRKCHRLLVQCGTAESGHSGLCNLETLRGTREPGRGSGKRGEVREKTEDCVYVWASNAHITIVLWGNMSDLACGTKYKIPPQL